MTVPLRLIAAWAAVALTLALLPTATAQANPHAKVSIEMTTSSEAATPGMEIARPATIHLEASNVTCNQETELVVELAVTGGTDDGASSAGASGNGTGASASGGLVASVEPTQLNYTISGTHQNVAGGDASYNQSADATVAVSVGDGAPPGANDIVLTATFPEQLPQGCQAMGQLPQSSATANFTVIAPEPEPDEDAFGNESEPLGDAGNDTAGGDSPAPAGPLVAAALAVAFVAAVRRKGY